MEDDLSAALSAPSAGQAEFAKRGGGGERGGSIICYRCGQPGHRAKQCPNQPQQASAPPLYSMQQQQQQQQQHMQPMGMQHMEMPYYPAGGMGGGIGGGMGGPMGGGMGWGGYGGQWMDPMMGYPPPPPAMWYPPPPHAAVAPPPMMVAPTWMGGQAAPVGGPLHPGYGWGDTSASTYPAGGGAHPLPMQPVQLITPPSMQPSASGEQQQQQQQRIASDASVRSPPPSTRRASLPVSPPLVPLTLQSPASATNPLSSEAGTSAADALPSPPPPASTPSTLPTAIVAAATVSPTPAPSAPSPAPPAVTAPSTPSLTVKAQSTLPAVWNGASRSVLLLLLSSSQRVLSASSLLPGTAFRLSTLTPPLPLLSASNVPPAHTVSRLLLDSACMLQWKQRTERGDVAVKLADDFVKGGAYDAAMRWLTCIDDRDMQHVQPGGTAKGYVSSNGAAAATHSRAAPLASSVRSAAPPAQESGEGGSATCSQRRGEEPRSQPSRQARPRDDTAVDGGDRDAHKRRKHEEVKGIEPAAAPPEEQRSQADEGMSDRYRPPEVHEDENDVFALVMTE